MKWFLLNSLGECLFEWKAITRCEKFNFWIFERALCLKSGSMPLIWCIKTVLCCQVWCSNLFAMVTIFKISIYLLCLNNRWTICQLPHLWRYNICICKTKGVSLTNLSKCRIRFKSKGLFRNSKSSIGQVKRNDKAALHVIIQVLDCGIPSALCESKWIPYLHRIIVVTIEGIFEYVVMCIW